MDSRKAAGAINSGTLWPAVVIAAISMAVYLNGLHNGFVWDDTDQLLNNSWIRDARHIPEIFTSNVWGFSRPEGNYYRPLMYIAFMVDYHVFRLNPAGFHFVNQIFHAGVSVMVYLLANRIWAGNRPCSPAYASVPFVAAVLFSVHPIHTEAVDWVSAFPEVSFTFFYLLSLYFYIRAVEDRRKYALALSAAFFFISSLCKETALTLPLVLLCYEHLFRKSKERPGEYLRRYIPFILAAAVYLAARLVALKGFAPTRHHPELTGYECLINAFPLFGKYMSMLLFPVDLNVFHVLHPIHSLADKTVVLPLAATLLFAGAAYVAFRKDRGAFLCMSIIAIPLLPVLYIPGIGQPIFAERYLYLPSLGFSMLAAFAAGRLENTNSRILAAGLVIVLVGGFYCAGTIARNRIWKDDLTLWADSVQKSPDGAFPHNNLGYAYLVNGMPDKAETEFRRALQLDPTLADAHYNLGTLYSDRGLADKAADEFKETVRLDPDSANAHNNLGNAYLKKGLADEAEAELRSALKLDPGLAEAHNNLAMLYLGKGLVDRAVEELQTTLKLDPTLAKVHYNLGAAYLAKGSTSMAADEFRTAVRLDPELAHAPGMTQFQHKLGGQAEKRQ